MLVLAHSPLSVTARHTEANTAKLPYTADAGYVVTNIVYFDVEVGSTSLGTIKMGLYGQNVPRTVENFRALCTGKLKNGENITVPSYRNTIFHRIYSSFAIQGGDNTNFDGSGGASIYGPKFDDENFSVKPSGKGDLMMANDGPNTNAAQFFFALENLAFLELNPPSHMVFGKVINDTAGVLDKIASYGSRKGHVSKRISITKSGEL